MEHLNRFNAAGNLLKFAENLCVSWAQLFQDFRVDVERTSDAKMERSTFASSVSIGIESIITGNFGIEQDDEFDMEDEYGETDGL